jgi:NarL family two-component system response regulator LiaR
MTQEQPIRILIADDHLVVREGVGAIIALEPDMELVGKAADGVEAISLAKAVHPDVILLDMVMPRQDGLATIHLLRSETPNARILVLTSFADDERVFLAIKAGALGYLLKDAPREQLLAAIRDVARGQAFLQPDIAMSLIREIDEPPDLPATSEPLTTREMETLRLIARGLTNQEIAAELTIHEYTVAKYVSNILNKLHLANRTQAALYALKQGIASLE